MTSDKIIRRLEEEAEQRSNRARDAHDTRRADLWNQIAYHLGEVLGLLRSLGEK